MLTLLVTNDDGILAPGIRALAEGLTRVGRVVVVAPDRERSGTSQAITTHKPLRVDPVDLGPGLEAYRVNGTPSDCVKLGIEAILGVKPDFVLSGINSGPNLGTDVLYSGTVSGAIEGLIMGVPSIALSLVLGERNDYQPAARFAAQLVEKLARESLPKDTLLNVNVPDLGEEGIQGVKATRLGSRRYQNMFHKRTDPRGRPYYWMVGQVVELDQDSNTDTAAVGAGYISVTPVQIDLTHYPLLETLKKWSWEDVWPAADERPEKEDARPEAADERPESEPDE